MRDGVIRRVAGRLDRRGRRAVSRKRSLSKRLSRISPNSEQFAASLAEFQGSSDRVCAIMGTALIEDTLVKTIGGCLEKTVEYGRLFHDEGGPFGTFKRRIVAARAFNLCSNEIEAEMEVIGEIRNQFAHALLSIDFENQDIAEKLALLQEPHLSHKRAGEVSANRLRFEAACWRISIKLLSAGSERFQKQSALLKRAYTPLSALSGLSDLKPTGLEG